MSSPPSRTLEAIEALKRFDRDRAAELIASELRDGPPSGERWKSVGILAGRIGEIDSAIEAARRYAATEPNILSRILHYCAELAGFGREALAQAQIERLPPFIREQPPVLHLRATLMSESGDFEEAARLFSRALDQKPELAQSWLALAMIKTFVAHDPDLRRMEALRSSFATQPDTLAAPFLYALAKAYDDCGDAARAFQCYADGARLIRARQPFDASAAGRVADRLISGFDRAALSALLPSRAIENRAIFVNGLPRSGTTLVEQILASHDDVAGGGEINLVRAALIPTRDYTADGAAAYQQHSASHDPWGDLARAYHRMLAMRLAPHGRIIDKTLNQSHFLGLLMHMLPQARVLWLRRDPEDTALSCFKTFFAGDVRWGWSLEDIGEYFRIEDRLFAHWMALFPGRVLAIPYEQLVRDPQSWVARIFAHVGLTAPADALDFHRKPGSVRTASVLQVRSPITAHRVGTSLDYKDQMEAFRKRYRGG